LKDLGADEYKDKEYTHINIHGDFANTFTNISDYSKAVGDPFKNSIDLSAAISVAVVSIVIGCIAVALSQIFGFIIDMSGAIMGTRTGVYSNFI
jgi:hypothetical protein